MQSEQYSQRNLNNLHLCATEPRSVFLTLSLPLSEFRFEGNVILSLPPWNTVYYFTLAKVSNLPPRWSSEFCMCEDAIV